MKTFSVAVAVAILLTFICILESSAALTEVQEPEEAMSNDSPAAEQQEETEDSWMMPYSNRQKRGIKCRICCGCCTPGVCGLCCKF